VITDDQHPFRFPEGSPGLFLVDGVAAAGEVKSVLTTAELRDIETKATKFKALQRSYGQGDHMMVFTSKGESPLTDRFFLRPAFFAIAFDSNVNRETLTNRLAQSDRKRGETPIGLDALFILGQGFAVNLGDGDGIFQMMAADGRTATGWIWSEGDTVLGDLLFWLASCERRVNRARSPLVPYLADLMKGRTTFTPAPPEPPTQR
jgi:hypothetical protein